MKVTFNLRMEATPNAKAEKQRSLGRTFATTMDVTVEDGEEGEENYVREEGYQEGHDTWESD